LNKIQEKWEHTEFGSIMMQNINHRRMMIEMKRSGIESGNIWSME
jgi:hypothetical protein